MWVFNSITIDKEVCYLGVTLVFLFYCCYILRYTITINKEGCYLGVTLVLPSTTATYYGILLLLQCASLGNTQVTPLIYLLQCPLRALHSTALQLPTVWSHCTGGTLWLLGVEIWQLCLRDTSRSAKWHQRAAVGHWVSLCVCSVVVWSIVYQLGILSLSCSQYSQTICWRGWDGNTCLGVRNTSSIGAWPNSLDWRPPLYCIVSPLL